MSRVVLKLNSNLFYRDVYLSIKSKSGLEFIANSGDIGFNKIIEELKQIGISDQFYLPIQLDLKELLRCLLQESVGIISIKDYEKMRMLVYFFGGKILYTQLDSEVEWGVKIVF